MHDEDRKVSEPGHQSDGKGSDAPKTKKDPRNADRKNDGNLRVVSPADSSRTNRSEETETNQRGKDRSMLVTAVVSFICGVLFG